MKKTSSMIASVVAAAAVAAVAVPAVAAARGSAASVTGVVGAPAARTGPTTTAVKSTAFAGYGYQGGGEGTFKDSTTFVVPKVKCGSGKRTKRPTRAVNASVGVYNASDGFSAADVFVGCFGSKAAYFPSLEVNTSSTKLHGKNYTKDHIRPGDKVKLAVSQSKSKVTVSVVDMTQKKIHVTLHGAGSASGSDPWVGTVGDNSHDKLLGVPNFGTMHFSKALLGGTPWGSAFPVRYDRYSKKGKLQIATTAFAKNHEAFATVFKHS